MSINPDSFRAVLGRFASGVTVVTCIDSRGKDQGMTVSAFCSVSLIPPLILICIDHRASMHKELPSMQHFAVNILASDQEEIARRFAESVDDHRFEGVGFTRGLHGIPLLDDTLANLECRQVSLYQGGDHTIVVGEVEAANMRDAKPLLYYRGGFAQIDR